MKKNNKIWDLDKLPISGWVSFVVAIVFLLSGLLSGNFGYAILGIFALSLGFFLFKRNCKVEDIEDIPNTPIIDKPEELVDEKKPKTDLEDKEFDDKIESRN